MLKVLAGPLIGALIGYITNYLAVRMLFSRSIRFISLAAVCPLRPGPFPNAKIIWQSVPGR